IGSFLVLVGCGTATPQPIGGGIASSGSSYQLRRQVDSLGWELQNLRGQILVLRSSAAPNYQSVQLDPTEKGYERIDTVSGFFLISCDDAKPYLDGYKLSLRVGNPTTATYSGFRFNVRWGGTFQSPSDTTFHQKDVSFTNTLKPASWNNVDLVITPATPEEMKSIFVSMETPEMKLYR